MRLILHGRYEIHVIVKPPLGSEKEKIHYVQEIDMKRNYAKTSIWEKPSNVVPIIKSDCNMTTKYNKHTSIVKQKTFDILLSISTEPKEETNKMSKGLQWTEKQIMTKARSYLNQKLKEIKLDIINRETKINYDRMTQVVNNQAADFVRVSREIMNPTKLDELFRLLRTGSTFSKKPEFIAYLNEIGPWEFYIGMRFPAINRVRKLGSGNKKDMSILTEDERLLWPNPDLFLLDTRSLKDIKIYPVDSSEEVKKSTFKDFPCDIMVEISLKSLSGTGPIDEVETNLWGDGLSQVDVVLVDQNHNQIIVAVHDIRFDTEDSLLELASRIGDPLQKLPDGRIPMGSAKVNIKRVSELIQIYVYMLKEVRTKSFVKNGDGSTITNIKEGRLPIETWNTMVSNSPKREVDLNQLQSEIKKAASSWKVMSNEVNLLLNRTIKMQMELRERWDNYKDPVSKTLLDRTNKWVKSLQVQDRSYKKINRLVNNLAESQNKLMQAQHENIAAKHQHSIELAHHTDLKRQRELLSLSKASEDEFKRQLKLQAEEVKRTLEKDREMELYHQKALKNYHELQNNIFRQIQETRNSHIQNPYVVNIPSTPLAADISRAQHDLLNAWNPDLKRQFEQVLKDQQRLTDEQRRRVLEHNQRLIDDLRRIESTIQKDMQWGTHHSTSIEHPERGFFDPFSSYSSSQGQSGAKFPWVNEGLKQAQENLRILNDVHKQTNKEMMGKFRNGLHGNPIMTIRRTSTGKLLYSAPVKIYVFNPVTGKGEWKWR